MKNPCAQFSAQGDKSVRRALHCRPDKDRMLKLRSRLLLIISQVRVDALSRTNSCFVSSSAAVRVMELEEGQTH